MSQHYFTTTHNGDPVTVTLGWDRPLSQYFMSIDPEDDEGPYIYSYLLEKKPCSSLDYYKAKLDDLGIQVPLTMFEQVEGDRTFGIGNRCTQHSADGSFVDLI